jgi:transposase-like protein
VARGVRLALESGRPIAHVAADLGMHPETLRKKVRQAEADSGARPDLPTTAEREEIRKLRAENFELRRCAQAALRQNRKGSKWLRASLAEAAIAAKRTKQSYLAAQYQRPRGRRNHLKTLTAVGHSILTAIWHILTTGELYGRRSPCLRRSHCR